MPQDSSTVKSRKNLAISTMQLSSSMTISAARAHHGAGRDKVVIVDRSIEQRRGQAAAGGAAGLHGLELLAAGDAAADVVDDLAQRGAHGNLDQTGVVDLAAESEDLGALGASRCRMEANQSAPLSG